MKLYWPIALTCSVVGCIVFMPIAGDVPAPQIFVGVENIGYALASGALMAVVCRPFFTRAGWTGVIALSGLFGLVHVSLFGAMVGLLSQGVRGLIEDSLLAPKLALDKFYIFLPLCLGAHGAIKWAAHQEVENVSIFD